MKTKEEPIRVNLEIPSVLPKLFKELGTYYRDENKLTQMLDRLKGYLKAGLNPNTILPDENNLNKSKKNTLLSELILLKSMIRGDYTSDLYLYVSESEWPEPCKKVQKLIDWMFYTYSNKLNINYQSPFTGKTALHIASSYADMENIENLLAFDANYDVKNREGATALDCFGKKFFSYPLNRWKVVFEDFIKKSLDERKQEVSTRFDSQKQESQKQSSFSVNVIQLGKSFYRLFQKAQCHSKKQEKNEETAPLLHQKSTELGFNFKFD